MLKHSLCREALIKIYMSFIRPILEYVDIIWDNCSERDAALLEDVQVTAARIITGIRINSSRTILYNELGWDALSVRRKVHKLILFYKIVYGLAPLYLLDLSSPNLISLEESGWSYFFNPTSKNLIIYKKLYPINY